MKARFTWAKSEVERLFRRIPPARLMVLGYVAYIVVGWLLLCLPWAHTVSGVSMLDHLFIATSAVSTTGLTTVSVSDTYGIFGQLVVLALIQMGGIGYMTFGSFVMLARRNVLSPTREGIGKTVFSLPESFDLRQFIRFTVLFTVLIEALGASALYVVFRQEGAPHAAWNAVFHSVSAFCTAGFSLYNTSFEGYAGHVWLNAIIGILSIAGAVGFIVFADFWRYVTGCSRSLTITSHIILWSTGLLLVAGTTLFFLQEPLVRDMPFGERALAACFQAMTAMTTVGFNTVSIGALSKASILLLVVLMVIGSSPSGTGGGLKCTTVSAFFGIMRGVLRGDTNVHFWKRSIPMERIWMAVGSVGFYLTALMAGTYLLDLTESAAFDQILFEAASALGTVGLSMGITSALTVWGKMIIIALMFCGRIGPLTFGLAFLRNTPCEEDTPNNDFAV